MCEPGKDGAGPEIDLRQGKPDLRQGKPDLRQGKPDLRQGKPDLRQGKPDLSQGSPDLALARTLMEKNCGFTCVLVKGDTVHASTARGVRPMADFMSQGLVLSGYAASDKVVGKAPALLFVLAGVKEVYAPIMSRDALRVLQEHGVTAVCGRTVPIVRNRADTGACPMELAVKELEDPVRAFAAIRETLLSLSGGGPVKEEERSHT